MYSKDYQKQYKVNDIYDKVYQTLVETVSSINGSRKLDRFIRIVENIASNKCRTLAVVDSNIKYIHICDIVSEKINKTTGKPYLPLTTNVTSEDIIKAVYDGVTKTQYLMKIKR